MGTAAGIPGREVPGPSGQPGRRVRLACRQVGLITKIKTAACSHQGLLSSFLGRATGTLLNEGLHFTDGETEAGISAWPEAIQFRVVETGFESHWSDCSLDQEASYSARCDLFPSSTGPLTPSSLSRAL